MNGRQRILVDFLFLHHDWITTKELLNQLRDLYPNNDPANRNSTARRNLTRDIRELNESPDFSGIIVHGTRGIKLANKREADHFLKSRAIECARSWKLLHAQARKLGLNMQIDIDGREKNIDAPLI